MDIGKIWEDYFSGKYEDVLNVGANAAEVMHIAALSLVSLKRYDEASTLFMASSLVSPRPDWFSNACISFLNEDKADLALTFALTGIKDFPNDAGINFNAANVFSTLGQHEEAKTALLKSLSIDSENWEAAMNLANAYRRLDDLTNAMIYYDIALSLNKDDMQGKIRTKLNKAVTLSDLGFDRPALMIFNDLANEHIISPEMDFNRATLKLKLGDFKGGWKLYKKRWDCSMAKNDVARFQKPLLTKIEEGIGKKVLFCQEQGFGDCIQFARYAPLLKEKGIDITILCLSPLVRLFETMDIPVITSRDDFEYDYECPMLDAPYLFDTTIDTIPNKIPYFNIPEELIAQRKFEGRGRLKIGFVWSGQSRDNAEMKLVDAKRSIQIQDFYPLIRDIDADFCNLQFGPKGLEFIEHNYAFPFPFLSQDYDFLDTAAVIKNLDLVISVDTSVAHLSASVGTPTWILSRYDGCWRWLKNRTDSPWYPNIVKLFHQSERGNWHSVIEEIKIELNKLL